MTQMPAATSSEDARRLALELAGLRPARSIDLMALGVVLQPEERALSVAAGWLSVRVELRWQPPCWAGLVVTDRRVLARLPAGDLASLWWGAVVGLDIDLVRGQVILDGGDGAPRALTGPHVAPVAVAAVWALYGVEALLTHRGLGPLRDPAPCPV